MKISKVIAELTKLHAEHGDLEVKIEDDEYLCLRDVKIVAGDSEFTFSESGKVEIIKLQSR